VSTSFLLERVNSILTFLIIWRNIITAEKSECVPMMHRRTLRELQLPGGSVFEEE
jgi:hypothetical protein